MKCVSHNTYRTYFIRHAMRKRTIYTRCNIPCDISYCIRCVIGVQSYDASYGVIRRATSRTHSYTVRHCVTNKIHTVYAHRVIYREYLSIVARDMRIMRYSILHRLSHNVSYGIRYEMHTLCEIPYEVCARYGAVFRENILFIKWVWWFDR